MQLDQEVSNKLVELDQIKAEIAELVAEKARIVKEINVPFYEAKAKADKVIADAQAQADGLVKAAAKVKEDANMHRAKVDHSISVDMAKVVEAVHQLDAERTKLENDKLDFSAQKQANENLLGIKRSELAAQEVQATRRHQEAQEASINAGVLQATLRRKEDDLNIQATDLESLRGALNEQKFHQEAKKDELKAVFDDFEKRRDNLHTEFAAYEKVKKAVEKQTEINADLTKRLNAQKEEQDRQKYTINSQFALLEKTTKDSEERVKALDEREQLITLKDREVEQKIKTLQEIRKKNVVV